MMTKAYFVAMCDVLGFSQLVAETSLEEVHQKYRALLDEAGPASIYRTSPETSERTNLVEHIVFSDTILFWAPADGRIEILPGLLSILMKQVIGSMPLRAGIAFGDCVIDSQRHVYLGQPIIDAFRTEQAQEWVGGAYHPSCLQAPGFREFLGGGALVIEYQVPVKLCGPRTYNGPTLKHAVNWPLFCGPDVLEIIADQEGRSPKESRAKWQHTRAFYQACKNPPSPSHGPKET
jgi:hypothetical protein